MKGDLRHLLFHYFNVRPSDTTRPIYDKSGRRYWAGYEIDETENFPCAFGVYRFNHTVGLINFVWDKNTKEIDLGDLFIVPKYRDQGIGAAFFHWFVQVVRTYGAQQITGVVHPEDWSKLHRLVGWYKRNGFTVTGKNERYVLSMRL